MGHPVGMQYLWNINPAPKPLHLLRESRYRENTEKEHKWSPKEELTAPPHDRRHMLRRYPTRLRRRQADGSQGQIPVKENHLSPLQIPSNHHGWRNNLRKSSYRSLTTRTLWIGDQSAERSVEPRQPPLPQEARGHRFRLRRSAGQYLRSKYPEHVLPDKIHWLSSRCS